jgi:hypothetical protein
LLGVREGVLRAGGGEVFRAEKPGYLAAHKAEANPRRFEGAFSEGTAARLRPVKVKFAKRSSAAASFGKSERRVLWASVSRRTDTLFVPC